MRSTREITRPNSKLTEQSVREIRASYMKGYRRCDLARSFGVSERAIHSILIGETWRHTL
jgi:uncharacterized protein YjcR